MGLIRIILAFSVLVAHSAYANKFMIPGDTAVQLFFIISGFYMAMILNKKYRSNTAGFYKNRFLRLYPIYFTVLVFIFVFGLASDKIFGQSANNYHDIFLNLSNGNITFFSACFLIFSNISMLFQDTMTFLRIQNGVLVFGNFHQSNPPLYSLMLMPQAWSLSLELMFYAIAPFVVKSKKRIAYLIFISMLIRVVLHILGYSTDPFDHRFFGSEISVFLLGSLAYHLFDLEIYQKIRKYIKAVVGSLILIFILWPYIFNFNDLGRYLFFIVFATFLPYIFQYFKDNKKDAKTGELSYPFYLIHLVALQTSEMVINRLPINIHFKNIIIIILATVVSILGSIILMEVIQKPFEKIRKRNSVAILLSEKVLTSN